jgi:dTMP kinase
MGEQLREILLDHDTGKLEPKTEAMLFGAARAQLVSTVIRPALEQGKVVLCDRYIDSSLAYQGVARGLGELDVLTLNVWATQGLFPDLVVLLHLEPEQGLERSLAVDGEHDRIESEGADFHAKVANAYLHIAEEHPERIVVIDSGRPPGDVAADVQTALRKVIPEAEARDGSAGSDTGDGKGPANE